MSMTMKLNGLEFIERVELASIWTLMPAIKIMGKMWMKLNSGLFELRGVNHFWDQL